MPDIRHKQIAEFIAPFRVKPGSRVVLSRDFDPAFKAGVRKKKDGEELLRQGVEMLSEFQEKLAAQDTYGVLVVLQALDAADKDGTIRHVMSGVNPQGVERLSIFGSVARDEAGEDSDVDILVEFTPGAHVGMFEFLDVQEALATLLGCKVDLATPGSLHLRLRDTILGQAILAA